MKRISRCIALCPSPVNPGSAQATSTTMMKYPLRHSDPIESKPSFYSLFKKSQSLAVATERVKTHLNDPIYRFPSDFIAESTVVGTNALKALSNPQLASHSDALLPFMTSALAHEFVAANASLNSQGLRPSFSFTDVALKMDGIQLVYGPWPVPKDYASQEWLGCISLIIPIQDSEFSHLDAQTRLVSEAMQEGIYIKIKCFLDGSIQWTDGNTVVSRSRLPLEFVSPLFLPSDELFRIKKDGSWKLLFSWRLSEFDECFSQ